MKLKFDDLIPLMPKEWQEVKNSGAHRDVLEGLMGDDMPYLSKQIIRLYVDQGMSPTVAKRLYGIYDRLAGKGMFSTVGGLRVLPSYARRYLKARYFRGAHPDALQIMGTTGFNPYIIESLKYYKKISPQVASYLTVAYRNSTPNKVTTVPKGRNMATSTRRPTQLSRPHNLYFRADGGGSAPESSNKLKNTMGNRALVLGGTVVVFAGIAAAIATKKERTIATIVGGFIGLAAYSGMSSLIIDKPKDV